MKKERTPRTPTIHETDILLDKDKLKEILDRRGMEYMELWERVVKKYGLDLTYKGFMSLLSNRSTWKLLYAHAISDILLINYTEIFNVVSVDVERVAKQKEKWKERYQHNS